MRKWSIETLSLAGVALVLTLVVMLAALVWQAMAASKTASVRVDHLHERVAWLEQVRADLYRTEAEQQHYLNHPGAASLARRDARLALLEQRLAEDNWIATDASESLTQLRRLRNYLHRQVKLQAPGQASAGLHADLHAEPHDDSTVYLDQTGAMIGYLIDNERDALGRLKATEERQNLLLRCKLAILLASLALASVYILLKVRAMSIARKAAHVSLQLSETRYRQIVDTAHEGIWLTDADDRVLLANRRMGDLLGVAAADLPGRLVNEFFEPALLRRICAAQDADGVLRDLHYPRLDGSTVWVVIGAHTLHGADGMPEGALMMATDITERKLAERALAIAHAELENRIRLRTAELIDLNSHLRAEIGVRKVAEQALAQSEQQLQEIIAMMPVALFLKDADSALVLMNDACEQQWGISFEALSRQRDLRHFPPEQVAAYLADDRAAFAGKRLVVSEELVWNHRLQQNRLVQTYKKPLFDALGKPLLLIAMSIDITERTRNEEALRQSFYQLRALSAHQETIKEEERRRIAREIHDDLGQNLMALKIDVTMLHARTSSHHPRLQRHLRRALDTIDTTITSVRAIINDLHPSTLELGLSAAVEWLLRQLEQRSAVRFALAIVDDSAGAALSQRQTLAIFRIIQESLSNILRHAHASHVDVTLDLNCGRVAVVIADDGVGMLPADHRKATSFGLKNIRERIDAFGGTLLIDSRQGVGTVLSIMMPVGQAGALQADAAQPAA